MTGVDLHPEELLDRVRRGAASADEQRRAAAHIAGCLACRAEHLLITDGAAAAAPVPGDGETLARVQARARRTIRTRLDARRGRRRAGREGGLRGRRFALAFVFVLFAGAVAVAAPFVHRAWRDRRAAFPAPVVDRSARVVAAARDEGEGEDEGQDEDGSAPAPVAHPRVVHQAVRPSRAEARAPVGDARETAAELFARANRARREGNPAEVVASYRRLQLEHAASREAAVSHVALGRWLLDRMRDPRSALAQFDAYLHQGRHDTLREEALVGRATALEQLRRPDEERRAWEALLAAYPRSASAARARARIEALP